MFVLHELVESVKIADVHLHELVVRLAFDILEVREIASIGELVKIDNLVFRILIHEKANYVTSDKASAARDYDCSFCSFTFGDLLLYSNNSIKDLFLVFITNIILFDSSLISKSLLYIRNDIACKVSWGDGSSFLELYVEPVDKIYISFELISSPKELLLISSSLD